MAHRPDLGNDHQSRIRRLLHETAAMDIQRPQCSNSQCGQMRYRPFQNLGIVSDGRYHEIPVRPGMKKNKTKKILWQVSQGG